MLSSKKLRILSFIAGILISNVSFAAAKTLITFEGGKPGPGLATAWKKGKGSYDFTLNAKADIGQGEKGLAAVVKQSLESKLGESHGVKVTAKGKSTVTVKYTGDENEFLTAVSTTRIRPGDNTEIAAASTVSQGGVRAKTAERDPIDGEVKGNVVSVKGDSVFVRVTNTSAKTAALGIKAGDKVEIKSAGYAGKKDDKIFFMPSSKEGNAWAVTGVKAE